MEEEARFWDMHDTTEYAWEDLDETIEVSGPLKHNLEARRRAREKAKLELEPHQLRAAQKIARRKRVSYLTLIKRWIDEAIARESA